MKRHIILLILLFLSHLLFLWMFLATGGLEQMAMSGHITGPEGWDVKTDVYRFAAEWRHGMSGGSPLYMPGYFITTAVTWLWSKGRRLLTLLIEGFSVLSLAAVEAKLLAPLGTSWLVDIFTQQTGSHFDGILLSPSISASFRGIFTLIMWSTFIVAGQRSLMTRSLRPLWLPLTLGLILAIIRPVATLDDLSALWWERVVQGEAVAIFSSLAIPGVVAFLVKPLFSNAH